MNKKPAKKSETQTPRTWSRTAGGNRKWQFTIAPEHEEALVEEATKRAAARGSRRLDASEVLREILDEWIRKRSR
jgi:hypothetical protein